MLEWLLSIIKTEVPVPKPYGIYHICALAVIIALCVIFTRKVGNLDEASFRRLALITWIIIAVMELMKQTIYSFHFADGGIVADYHWFVFPFQFCSSPFYVFPLLFLCRERTPLYKCVVGFLVGYSFFAGLTVCLYPGDVFTFYLGIDIQTVIHHGAMVIMGVWLAYRNRRRLTLSSFAGGSVIFTVLVMIAMALNTLIHSYFVSAGITETCNLFFISPYYPCTLPLLSSIYPAVPYPVFVIIYFVGFFLAGFLCFYLLKGVSRLIDKNGGRR